MLGKWISCNLGDCPKAYRLKLAVSQDDQVKAYIKKIMSQLNRWMTKSKISKLVIVVTSKESGEDLERWQFDVRNCLSILAKC